MTFSTSSLITNPQTPSLDKDSLRVSRELVQITKSISDPDRATVVKFDQYDMIKKGHLR